MVSVYIVFKFFKSLKQVSNNISFSTYFFLLVESDMPEHDLEPPRFSRRALECLLGDWKAVKSMIMSGVSNESTKEGPYEDQPYVTGQTGTTLLDKFTHCFFVKCQMVLDVLLETIIKEMKTNDFKQREIAHLIARR